MQQPLEHAARGVAGGRAPLARLAWLGAALVLALGLSACGTGQAGAATATPTPAPTAAPAAGLGASDQIREAFVQFFDGNTPPATRIDLLQNGNRYAQLIQAESRLPNAASTSAQVSDIRIDGTQAAVTYSVLVNGKPVLQNQTGTAVLVGGRWKVGDQTFCQLVSAQGMPAQGCGVVTPAPAAPTTTK